MLLILGIMSSPKSYFEVIGTSFARGYKYFGNEINNLIWSSLWSLFPGLHDIKMSLLQ